MCVYAGITVHYSRGLPVVTVPLPSRKERCRFTLRPISHCVGDFQEMLRREDKGIDRVAVTTLGEWVLINSRGLCIGSKLEKFQFAAEHPFSQPNENPAFISANGLVILAQYIRAKLILWEQTPQFFVKVCFRPRHHKFMHNQRVHRFCSF